MNKMMKIGGFIIYGVLSSIKDDDELAGIGEHLCKVRNISTVVPSPLWQNIFIFPSYWKISVQA